jgi:CarD family transcriptional regulator
VTFQVGEKVVCPSYGVGTIESIGARSFGAALERFYLLRFSTGGMTVMAPLSRAASMGLRRVSKSREVLRVLSFLCRGDCPVNRDWKARLRENTFKLQSGDLLKTAEVLKSLLLLQRERPLSFSERRMMMTAYRMVVSEVSGARSTPEPLAALVLSRALAKAGLAAPAAA